MSKQFQARRLDVAAFAQAQAGLEGRDEVDGYPRVLQELHAPRADLAIGWRARGEERRAIDGSLRPALHLQVKAALPLTCQRCLGELTAPIDIDRHFIFVPDEDAAAALDDASDDDVLVLAPDFDLHALLEDELLMALPLVPRHEACPESVTLSAQDADFDAAIEERRKPFAALSALRKPDAG
ncbi:MAG: DUF177 domain-containing protein [Burkholderiales bacterium]|nr:DUF177 domain-containing protein [Burkholderiales bacterium]